MSSVFGISLAERQIEIECRHQTVYRQCRDYLCGIVAPDLRIAITQAELEASAGDSPLADEHYEGVATTRFYGETESLLVYEKIAQGMLAFDTFLMHGAVVAMDGQAYMFIAPSGTGKTTRIRLWLDAYPGSFVVNGDKPLIRLTERGAFACGTPWCGKEGYNTNAIVPLRAVFLLERAGDGNPSAIARISGGQAFPVLLQQTYKPKDAAGMVRTLQLLKKLDGKTAFYRFRSAPTEEAIRLARETAGPR